MISLKSAFAYVLLLATAAKVTAFDAKECDVYVFRTTENALWHCGNKLPGEPGKSWESLYCDHGRNEYAFPWASLHPDQWCAFMIATVREDNEDSYPLTTNVGTTETPGPNIYAFETIKDWGCYMVENLGTPDAYTRESYFVDSTNGDHASTVHEQCHRNQNYFDYWNLHPHIRDQAWHGKVPDVSYSPTRTQWGSCHYDDMKSQNYVAELGVGHAECMPGYVCEVLFTDAAFCFPDPKLDHECCISWHLQCKEKGDCCIGSECNDWGKCEPGLEQQYEDPPGICQGREEKKNKSLYSRCAEYNSEDPQGDCADGYHCVGDWVYSECKVNPAVKDECCKWEYDDSNPRPGDCCKGWMSYCHAWDGDECISSQCLPGRQTGQAGEWLDVHDRLCKDVPVEASFNELLDKCTGAICGVWGDPHIVTCDNLTYDCQGVGIFTLMQNHMFNVQANFVYLETPWGGASVTNDFVIDYVKEGDDVPNGVPTMQWSFPNFDKIDDPANPVYPVESRMVGACPLMFYLDGVLQDISGVGPNGYLYGDASSDYSVRVSNYNQIDVQHLAGTDGNGDKYYSNSVIWVDGSGPFTQWSCILTYFICLPTQDQELFKKSFGLLGTPTGTTQDDWMSPDGHTLSLPDHDRTAASFNYCVDNWCVDQESSILTYEDGMTYEDYMCTDQEYEEFDVNTCENSDQIIADCLDSAQPIACQMEKCIGNPEVEEEIDNVNDVTKHDADEDENFVEFPDSDAPDYGDCANLGSGLSGSTGVNAWDIAYPNVNCVSSTNNGFSVGFDNSASVLVGGSFTCKQGAGFEGRGVFLGDMILKDGACERLAATSHGSLIHPPDHHVCIEVGGDVNIEATWTSSKYIMYEFGNLHKACHMSYKNGCKLNGNACPDGSNHLEELGEQYVYTNGDFKKDADLDLTRWEDEITLLQQKTEFWKTIEANGVITNVDGNLYFASGVDNNPVQVFKIQGIDDSVSTITFSKELLGRTILIQVEGDGRMQAPLFCYHPEDSTPTDAPRCGKSHFPSELTGSIAWLFPTENHVELYGIREFQGSIVKPFGDMTIKFEGHSGRLIVGGDLIMDGRFTELHNYEFDPQSHPLPLADDLESVCEIAPPPACEESYKTQTSKTVCPSNSDGVVKLIRSSAAVPEDEPILYGIIIEPPSDPNSAHTVKFKIDNPFTNHTDIFIKHVKKVGQYAMDPTCESMPFTAGCEKSAKEIEVGCHEYDGVAPFALVNIYFASNSDDNVMDIGSDGGVTIDKCCKPAQEYETGYGIVEYTFEIQCTCPDGVAEA